MAEERFADKSLAKKDDAKIKGEILEEKTNPHEHKPEEAVAEKPKTQKPLAHDKAKTDKPAAKAKKTDEEKPEKPARKTVLERQYTVNLTGAYAKPKYKRADKAISLLQEFALRHMKGNDVKVEPELNNAIRTSNRPQKKVHVLLQKDEAGTVYAALVPKA